MSQFSQCLEIKTVKAAYIKCNASVIELNSAASKFNKLDANNPNLRQYAYINKEFEAAEQALKADNHTFVQHILHASQVFHQTQILQKIRNQLGLPNLLPLVIKIFISQSWKS